jgi:tetratricopeptide (TPR) repeat protein
VLLRNAAAGVSIVARKQHHQKPILPKGYRQGSPRPESSSRLGTSKGALDALREVIQWLRRGNTDQALQLVTRVLNSELTPAVAGYARQVAAEVHFRSAVAASDPQKALQHLNEALELTPEIPKLLFYRAIALWRMGRVSEALADLDFVAAREPDRPKVKFLCQLAKLATGQPWAPDGMTPAEANTMRLVAGLVHNASRAELLSLAEGPLMGRDPRLWRALITMQDERGGNSVQLLQEAATRVGRTSISKLLFYYQGVAALMQGAQDTALTAWLNARNAGLSTSWLHQNLVYLARVQALNLAEAGKWADVVALAERITNSLKSGGSQLILSDRILAETVGAAYFNLGYEAAQKGQWRHAVVHWNKASQYAPSRYLAQNLALAQEALQNWHEAATAWREVARRRPRKPDHPDYLTDAQVAAIWSRAAECYERAGDMNQAIACLKAAVNCTPEDTALRLRLADTMKLEERDAGAQAQLEQLLERDPQNVDALLRLAALYDESWNQNPEPLWRRVLAIQPDNEEAREGLAQSYLARVQALPDKPRFWQILLRGSKTDPVEILKQGLAEVPDHPRLLLELGRIYAQRRGTQKQAEELLLRAYRVSPSSAAIAGSVLHELLHVAADDKVEELVPEIKAMPGLLPAFWMDQARMALHCQLNKDWARRFFELAFEVAKAGRDKSTQASLLLQAFEICATEKAKDLANQYAALVEQEAPESGAVEYLKAYRLYHENNDVEGALRLIRKAKQMARKAKDEGVLGMAEEIEMVLGLQGLGFPGLSKLVDLLGGEGLFPGFQDDN